MPAEQETEILELRTALAKAERRENLLAAKLSNQVARYEKLQAAGQEKLQEDQEKLQDSHLTVQLRAELLQCQVDLERKSRERNHLLTELSEAQSDYLEVDLKFQLEAERSSVLQTKLEKLSGELEHLRASSQEGSRRLNDLEQANGNLVLEKEALQNRLAAGSQMFKEFVESREGESELLKSLQTEAKNFQNRLTQSFIECEKLKEQKESLKAEVMSQRQRLLDNHLQPSAI